MSANIIDGKAFAASVRQKVASKVADLKETHSITPGLAVVLVGEDPASQVYVRSKGKQTIEVGMNSFEHKLDVDTPEEVLLALIDELNSDPIVHGILVQLPLPNHLDESLVTNHIAPEKDVDGFHPTNFGKMALNLPTFISATPHGIMELLKRYNVPTEGKHTVVIGRSDIVGKPISILMGLKTQPGNSTVTLAHSRTKNIEELVSEADIIISALGIPNFVKAEIFF